MFLGRLIHLYLIIFPRIQIHPTNGNNDDWRKKCLNFTHLFPSYKYERNTVYWLLRWHSGKESACNAGNLGLDPWVGKISWRREWLSTPVFLLGEFHGQRNLVGYSPQGLKELAMIEKLTLFIFRLL